jgi:hypothetical protein
VVEHAQAHAVARVPQPVREAALLEVALGDDVVAFDVADLRLAAGALLGSERERLAHHAAAADHAHPPVAALEALVDALAPACSGAHANTS